MSSTNTLCLRSALLFASDSGVMCSATHAGLRVRRSYVDVRDAAGRRSLTGPGKPYWKMPLGSTGGLRAAAGEEIAGTDGDGRGGPVTVVVVVVEIGVGEEPFLEEEEE